MLPNPLFPANLVTFTEETRNRKLHFLCSCQLGHRRGTFTPRSKSRASSWNLQEKFLKL